MIGLELAEYVKGLREFSISRFIPGADP